MVSLARLVSYTYEQRNDLTVLLKPNPFGRNSPNVTQALHIKTLQDKEDSWQCSQGTLPETFIVQEKSATPVINQCSYVLQDFLLFLLVK